MVEGVSLCIIIVSGRMGDESGGRLGGRDGET